MMREGGREEEQTKGSNQPILKCTQWIFQSLKFQGQYKKKKIHFPAAANVDYIPWDQAWLKALNYKQLTGNSHSHQG